MVGVEEAQGKQVVDRPGGVGGVPSVGGVGGVWGGDGPVVLYVEELLRGQTRALLRYRGQEYRLSVTRAGKLILTK